MSFVNDYMYMEPMATFTTWDWVEIYSTEYFCNAKVYIHTAELVIHVHVLLAVQ